jgi:formamidopyrimidine-DNA glycosylase
MPELPEVQTLVDDLNVAGLVGNTFTAARVFWPKTIADLSPAAFCRRIKGKVIKSIHLRMSGRLHLIRPRTKRSKHEHVVLSLDRVQQLRFHDTRKFGRMFLVEDAQSVLGQLGIEPLDSSFKARTLAQMLTTRKRLLKPLLLDQAFIAGLGNIYVDEALWKAKIHPLRLSNSLSNTEIKALHRAIPQVLKRGLKNLGTSLGTGKANFHSVARRKGRNQDQLNVFRRTGDPCPRCKAPVERIIVGQRSTHICPNCQMI